MKVPDLSSNLSQGRGVSFGGKFWGKFSDDMHVRYRQKVGESERDVRLSATGSQPGGVQPEGYGSQPGINSNFCGVRTD